MEEQKYANFIQSRKKFFFLRLKKIWNMSQIIDKQYSCIEL